MPSRRKPSRRKRKALVRLPPTGTGAPPLLTPVLADEMLELIRARVPQTVAARAVGICKATYLDWKAKGRSGQAPYADFLDQVEKALARAESGAVTQIAHAAMRTWTAAAWWLERRYPQRWARREKFEHAGADGGPMVVRHVIVWEDRSTPAEPGLNGNTWTNPAALPDFGPPAERNGK